MNVLTDSSAEAFFPREEYTMHVCTPGPSSESSGAHTLLVELLLQILQGGGTLIVAASAV